MKRRYQLIRFRKERNWFQRDVVTKLNKEYGFNISVSYYGMIEQGTRTPKLNLAFAIADVFDKSISEIFFCNQHNKMLG
ncbi:hypothetical protein GCM10011571_17540 [Marinithermofilum abyssi]|uniref:HTH cro/C1-type domain-containing protein n=1 Tax=Marinithermofilum abyssi TaxID=1571185 RepID=A0A8J2VF40_9BACL|nr:helix-turn-helix transcriptional regulator [Marinithermofilum abyssi]GGE16354.1 hypothetical protein GCM10011571_17540 [Marinithermofilum abyssi]